MSVFLYLAIVVMWLCVLVPMWLRRDRNTYADPDKDASPYAYEEQETDEDSANTLVEPLPVSPSTFAASSSSSPSSVSSSSVSASFPAESASGSSSVPEAGDEDASESGARETSPDAGTAPGAPSGASGAASHGDPGAGNTPAGPGPVRPAMTRAEAERRRAEGRRRARHVAKRRRLTLWCVLLLLASVVAAGLTIIPWWGVAPSVVLLGLYLAVLRATVQIDAERRRAAAQAHAERARRARRRAALLEAQRPVAEIIDLDAHRDEIFDQYAESPRRAVGD